MKLEEMPFEVNKQTLRYLSELTEFCDNFPTNEQGVVYTVETYINKEKPSYRSEENNGRFWEYLKKTKVATYEKPKQFVAVEYEDVGGVPLMYPKTLIVKALEPESIQRLADTAKQSSVVDSSKARVEFRDGVLTYKGERHAFQEQNGRNVALKVFDVLWPSRKIVVAGKTKKSGKIWKPLLLANKIDQVFDRSLSGYNVPSLKNMLKLLGDTENNIKRKKIPLRITRSRGVQIVLEYKQ